MPEDLKSLLNQKVDLLISEIAHFEPDELFSYLLNKNINKIILTHIHPDLNDKEDLLVNTGKKYFGKNKIIVAYDGLELNIK
ncbi:MAG: hypothetical protein ACP5OB_02250 [Candidatus Ratteibacteria bacterium]